MNVLQLLFSQFQQVIQTWKKIEIRSEQGQLAFKSALASVLAIFIAFHLGIEDPFWSGISAFVVMQAQIGASLHRAVSRIIGTLACAVLSVVIAGTIQNGFLFLICLFAVIAFLLYESVLSDNPYIWIIGAATLVMADIYVFIDVNQVIPTAYYRTLDIVIGSLTTWVISALSEPAHTKKPWKEIFSTTIPLSHPKKMKFMLPFVHINKIALIHGVRGALSVLTVPLIWLIFALPGLNQIAVSVIAILQIELIATKTKGISRILGCALGAIIATLVISLSITNLFWFLLIDFIALYFFAYIHHNKENSYVGTQAAVVFLVTVIAKLGPPISFVIIFERLSGILLGVLTTILITEYLWYIPPKKIFSYQLQEVDYLLKKTIEAFLDNETPPSIFFSSTQKALQSLLTIDLAKMPKQAVDHFNAAREIYHQLKILDELRDTAILQDEKIIPITLLLRQKELILFALQKTFQGQDSQVLLPHLALALEKWKIKLLSLTEIPDNKKEYCITLINCLQQLVNAAMVLN